jgi:hypothetical protein
MCTLFFFFVTLVVEFEVALGARDDHVDPDAHEFARGRHQVKVPVAGLDHEGGLGVGRLDRSHVVHVDLVDGLKVDRAAQLRLVLVHVVGERARGSVEHEPPLVPGLELLAHLEQVAAARGGVQVNQRLTGVRVELVDELVAAVLDVLLQVEVGLAYG